MPTLAEVLSTAFTHFYQKRYADAERTARAILAADPKQAYALHLLGMIAYEFDRYELAADYFERSIDSRGPEPDFYQHLADAYRNAGQTAKAIDRYRQSLRLRPDHGTVLWSLSLALA